MHSTHRMEACCVWPDCRATRRHARAIDARHNRALRGVADRLLAMLIAMLKSGSLYEPARRNPPPKTAEAITT